MWFELGRLKTVKDALNDVRHLQTKFHSAERRRRELVGILRDFLARACQRLKQGGNQ